MTAVKDLKVKTPFIFTNVPASKILLQKTDKGKGKAGKSDDDDSSKSDKVALKEAANKTQSLSSKKTGGKEKNGEKKPKAKLAGVKAPQKHSKKVKFQPAVQSTNTGSGAHAAAAQKTERAKYLEVLLKGVLPLAPSLQPDSHPVAPPPLHCARKIFQRGGNFNYEVDQDEWFANTGIVWTDEHTSGLEGREKCAAEQIRKMKKGFPFGQNGKRLFVEQSQYMTGIKNNSHVMRNRDAHCKTNKKHKAKCRFAKVKTDNEAAAARDAAGQPGSKGLWEVGAT
ncbi:hypothetical protein Rhopal_000631-T1 [Rhodotorula paludigena]|uniref:Uncharacterized protein n=1 Tax=Rhodotorula paludigena TaxID=86838 RepID=A0AAV5G592_9BASI|nr:hypothetical protein Rhopal_000631-T1 [Rhodotorula paludigena]